jgi:hypothetical protein
MPMPSMGIVALLFFCGAGVLFMLWVLYHFVLEGTRRETYRETEWPIAAPEVEREQPERRTRSSLEAPRIRAQAR